MGGGEQQIAGSCAAEEAQIDTLEHGEDNVSIHVLTNAPLTTFWKGALFSQTGLCPTHIPKSQTFAFLL